MTQARLSMVVEVAQGIKGFFDAFVGTKLLYKSEQVKKLMIILTDEGFDKILQRSSPSPLPEWTQTICYILTGSISRCNVERYFG